VSQRIVILGGGPAGYEAALVAAELGADVTIVADEGLGGNSVLWDSVPSKALIVAAEAMGWVHIADELGVHLPQGKVDRTFVDFPKVASNVLELGANQSADIESKVSRSGVTVLRGRGRLAGSHRVEVTGADGATQLLEADFVLLATGSSARVLPFFTPDGERVLTGQHVYGLPEVPEHLIVVGSGATGAEFANAFRRFGAEVTLVSSRRLILPTEDPDAAQVIEDVFERRGMTILREARAVSCERRGDEVVVGLKDGGEVVGSHVLFTVGQVPAASDLGLENVSVQTNDWGGIDVDTVGRTSCRWIYAAGDVTGRVMLASVAAMQGRTAMWHALGQAVQPIRWDAVASTIFTDPEVATVGLSAEESTEAGIPVETARLDFQGNPRAKMTRATDGFVKVHAQVGSGTVVGGVVVSMRASDLIQPLAVAVQNRLSVAQVAQTITVYPSMAGSVAEACRMLMARLDR
jgi:NAD(P)H dehydrogenase (quinone)